MRQTLHTTPGELLRHRGGACPWPPALVTLPAIAPRGEQVPLRNEKLVKSSFSSGAWLLLRRPITVEVL